MENKEEIDKQCFDCGGKPADWASINNGIFICLKCTVAHRAYGPNVSFIKSLTHDAWNDNMFKCLQMGGNYRLKQFLAQANVPSNMDKGTIFVSKLMGYYRRMLKSQVSGTPFYEQMPPLNEYWNVDTNITQIDNTYMNRGDFNINQFSPPNQYYSQTQFNPICSGKGDSKQSQNQSTYPQFNDNNNFNKNNDFPQPEPKPQISSGYNQYAEAQKYAKYPPDQPTNQQSFSNPYTQLQPQKPPSTFNQYSQQQQYNPYTTTVLQQNQQQKNDFKMINSNYSNNNINKNPPNPNQGNDIYSRYNNMYSATGMTYQPSIGSSISNFFGKVWDKTKETTSNLKEKIEDINIGDKLSYAGNKTVDGVKYAGNKIYETGSDGYSYVKDKVSMNNNNNQNNNQYNYY